MYEYFSNFIVIVVEETILLQFDTWYVGLVGMDRLRNMLTFRSLAYVHYLANRFKETFVNLMLQPINYVYFNKI